MNRLEMLHVGWLQPALKYTLDRLGQVGLDQLDEVLPQHLISRPDGHVTLPQAYQWGLRLSQLFPDQDAWTEIAITSRLRMAPAIDTSIAGAETLEEAIYGLQEGVFHQAGIQVQIDRGPYKSVITVHPPGRDISLPDVGCRHRAILVIFVIREFVGPRWTPEKIVLGGDAVVGNQFLGAPVEYCPRTSIWEIDTDLLDRTRVTPETPETPATTTSCTCGQTDCCGDSRTFAHDVADVLREQLPFLGVPSAREMAERIGVSDSKLKRCLRHAGFSYKDITDQVRFQVAKRLLRHGHAVPDVAREVHYADTKAFRRAFTRISTLDPKEYRDLYHAYDEDPLKTIKIFRKVV